VFWASTKRSDQIELESYWVIRVVEAYKQADASALPQSPPTTLFTSKTV
jgi:hypothetical protein